MFKKTLLSSAIALTLSLDLSAAPLVPLSYSPILGAQAQVFGSVTVGSSLKDVALNGTLGVVADSSDNKVYFFDTDTQLLTGSIGVGTYPYELALSGTLGAVANQNSNNLSFFDANTQAILGTLSVSGTPLSVALNGTLGAVTYSGGTFVNLFDASNQAIIGTIFSPSPFTVALSGTLGAVTNASNSSVNLFDTQTQNIIGTVITSAYPFYIALNGTTGAVAYLGGTHVNLFDADTQTITGTLYVGPSQNGIALNNTYGAVSNYTANTISIFNTQTNAILQTLIVGLSPSYISLNPTFGAVSNSGSVTLFTLPYNTIFNTASGDWNATASWSDGIVPTSNDNATFPQGTTQIAYIYPYDTASAGSLTLLGTTTIDGGSNILSLYPTGGIGVYVESPSTFDNLLVDFIQSGTIFTGNTLSLTNSSQIFSSTNDVINIRGSNSGEIISLANGCYLGSDASGGSAADLNIGKIQINMAAGSNLGENAGSITIGSGGTIFINDGLVALFADNIQITADDVFIRNRGGSLGNSSGTFSVEKGTILNQYSTIGLPPLPGEMGLNAELLLIKGGTITNSALLGNNATAVQILGGSITNNTTGTIAYNGSLTMSGGFVDNSGDFVAGTISNLKITGGTLVNTGTVAFKGSLTIAGGDVQNSGDVARDVNNLKIFGGYLENSMSGQVARNATSVFISGSSSIFNRGEFGLGVIGSVTISGGSITNDTAASSKSFGSFVPETFISSGSIFNAAFSQFGFKGTSVFISGSDTYIQNDGYFADTALGSVTVAGGSVSNTTNGYFAANAPLLSIFGGSIFNSSSSNFANNATSVFISGSHTYISNYLGGIAAANKGSVTIGDATIVNDTNSQFAISAPLVSIADASIRNFSSSDFANNATSVFISGPNTSIINATASNFAQSVLGSITISGGSIQNSGNANMASNCPQVVISGSNTSILNSINCNFANSCDDLIISGASISNLSNSTIGNNGTSVFIQDQSTSIENFDSVFASNISGSITINDGFIVNEKNVSSNPVDFGLAAQSIYISGGTIQNLGGARFAWEGTTVLIQGSLTSIFNDSNSDFASFNKGSISILDGSISNSFRFGFNGQLVSISGGSIFNNGIFANSAVDVNIGGSNTRIYNQNGNFASNLTGSLTINQATILNQNIAFFGNQNPLVVIQGGTIQNTTTSNFACNGTDVIIEDFGAYIDNDATFGSNLTGSLTILGGTIINSSNGIFGISTSDVFISGVNASITNTGNFFGNNISISNGSISNEGINARFGNGIVSLNISGGTFSNVSGAEAAAQAASTNVNISGGQITNDQISFMATNISNITISGGSLSNSNSSEFGTNVTGNFLIQGGSIYNNSAAKFGQTAANLNMSSGYVENNADFAFQVPSVFVNGGSIVNTSNFANNVLNLTIDGVAEITSSGLIADSFTGLLTINGGSTTNLSGGKYATSGAEIVISGGSTYNQGVFAQGISGSVNMSGAGYFENQNLFGPAELNLTGGILNNSGTISIDKLVLGARQSSNSFFTSGSLTGSGIIMTAGSVQIATPITQSLLTIGMGFDSGYIGTVLAPSDVACVSTINADVNVTGSGTFFLFGTVSGTMSVDPFGTFSPGGLINPSVETAKIFGNTELKTQSVTRMDFDATGNDLVNIYGGNLTLSGSPVLLLKAITPPATQSVYTLFQLSPASMLSGSLLGGTISGQFEVQGDQPLISYDLEYTGDAILLNANALPINSLPLTHNQKVIADTLDALNGKTNACLQAKIDQIILSTGEFAVDILDALDPSELKGQQLALEEMTFIVNDSLRDIVNDESKIKRGFIIGGYEKLNQSSYSQYNGFRTDAGYLMAGFVGGSEKHRLLMSAGAMQTSTNFKKVLSSASATSALGALSYTRMFKNWTLNVDGLGAYHFEKTDRDIVFYDVNTQTNLPFQTFNKTAHSHHKGYSLKGQLYLDHVSQHRLGLLYIYEQGSYMFTHENAFTEKGADCVNLNIKSSERNVARNDLGFNFELFTKAGHRPFFGAAWVYEYRFGGNGYRASFIGTDPIMKIMGLQGPKNLLKYNLGIKTDNRNTNFLFKISGLWSKKFHEEGVSLEIERRF